MTKHKATLSQKLNFTNINFLNEKKSFLRPPQFFSKRILGVLNELGFEY